MLWKKAKFISHFERISIKRASSMRRKELEMKKHLKELVKGRVWRGLENYLCTSTVGEGEG